MDQHFRLKMIQAIFQSLLLLHLQSEFVIEPTHSIPSYSDLESQLLSCDFGPIRLDDRVNMASAENEIQKGLTNMTSNLIAIAIYPGNIFLKQSDELNPPNVWPAFSGTCRATRIRKNFNLGEFLFYSKRAFDVDCLETAKFET